MTQVGSWIGNSKFTAEEQAEMSRENMKSVQDFVVATLAENTDRSKARREIAVFFIKFYTLMLFMCGMTFKLDPAWSQVWFNLATSTAVGGLVVSISVFFFGSHAIAKYENAKK